MISPRDVFHQGYCDAVVEAQGGLSVREMGHAYAPRSEPQRLYFCGYAAGMQDALLRIHRGISDQAWAMFLRIEAQAHCSIKRP